MLYAGLDLSRKRLDFHLLDAEGATVEVGAAPPDADGLRGLTERVARHGEPIRAAIESMNGARFVHDRLEFAGWQVEIADAQKVKGLAPLACKTDRIDAWVLAELARRDLVPAIWMPDPRVRAERERARWRLHLVRHRSSVKQRVHAVLLTHGKPCPVSDLFGLRGRELLMRLGLPDHLSTREGVLPSLRPHPVRSSRAADPSAPEAGVRIAGDLVEQRTDSRLSVDECVAVELEVAAHPVDRPRLPAWAVPEPRFPSASTLGHTPTPTGDGTPKS